MAKNNFILFYNIYIFFPFPNFLSFVHPIRPRLLKAIVEARLLIRAPPGVEPAA
jgi:glycopeptide antibiotics resistance protein